MKNVECLFSGVNFIRVMVGSKGRWASDFAHLELGQAH
jgi:hypothetical protein